MSRPASPGGSTRSSRAPSLRDSSSHGGPLDRFYGSRIERNRELQNSDSFASPIRAGTINERAVGGSLGRATDRLRPALLNRSISSPLAVPGRQRSNTTNTPIPSHQNNSEPLTPSTEWTVFGQLMENEGQLRSPRQPSSPRRPASRSRGHGRASSIRSVRSFVPSLLGREEPLMVQSPVMEEPPTAILYEGLHDPPGNGGPPAGPDYDSDSSEDTETVVAAEEETSKTSKWRSLFPLTTTQIPLLYRNMLKSSIAYFIGSLFTFNPFLTSFISDLASHGRGDSGKALPSGHMIATVAVYFHPAKTVGAMIEADLFFFFGIFYAAFVSTISMSVYWWLELQPGWEWLADALVLSWLGLSMSFLAWMKVYMANPQFNTACSMVAIIVFIVVANEGDSETLIQVTSIVACGSFISNLVCFLVWPLTATSNLQTNMTRTLDSFSTLLNLLTNTFLLEEGVYQPSLNKLHRAVEDHQNSFTTLKKSLAEAKSEWRFWLKPKTVPKPIDSESGLSTGHSRTQAYSDAIDSMNRLAQHLNGLRGGTRLQYELTKVGMASRGRGKQKATEQQQPDVEEVLVDEDYADTAMLEAAAAMFGDLVDDMGPPLKALSSTCAVSLKRLRDAFVLAQTEGKRRKKALHLHEFTELIEGIERSLLRFESTSNHAVLRLYRRSQMPSSDSVSDYFHGGEDNELTTGGDNEHVFLVYFFIFTLQEFARELVSLVDAMERVYIIENQRLTWWEWISGLFSSSWNALRSLAGVRSIAGGLRRKSTGLTRRFSAIISPRRKRSSFPKVKPHAPDTIQTPSWSNLTFYGKIKQGAWYIGTRLRERDTKYAFKTGMGAAILSAPSFFDSTRPIFVMFYGQWALISFFVVMSPTIGATNNLSLHRILGTLVGAALATGIYTLFPEEAVILSLFGFIFSLPCFYFIISKPAYMSAGRFVLLTYNLTCLFCYNLRDKDMSVVEIGLNRSTAVVVGVLYAAFISRFWWPAEARRELSKALSEFCLNIGWLYTRLVASNSFAPERVENDVRISMNERTSLLTPVSTRLDTSIQEFMAMELHLQIKLIEIQSLLAAAQHEPRLKGPFPVGLYRGILTSLQTILDKLHSMRCVTTREEWYTSVRQDFIVPVNKERHEMVGNIILYLSTLSSAFRIKAPLPPYLPPAEEARQRLVQAIRLLPITRNRTLVHASRQLLFFAYALTMKGVTAELDFLGRTLQDAFGVIGQTREEFDGLFLEVGSEEDGEGEGEGWGVDGRVSVDESEEGDGVIEGAFGRRGRGGGGYGAR